MEVDVPKEIPKQTRRNAKSSHTPEFLSTVFVRYLLLDQRACLPADKENHDCKGDFMYDDFVGPDVVDRDGDEAAEDVKRILLSLGWRGLETEQLVQDGAYGEEHG
jgi:hypothetical protein